jgi:hypothetical protein
MYLFIDICGTNFRNPPTSKKCLQSKPANLMQEFVQSTPEKSKSAEYSSVSNAKICKSTSEK